jgi:AcrR family transcriptional regulator
MARTGGTAGNRLSVDDWVDAGYAILAAEGMKALKIDRLCDRLGVTKGSFYWHFDGMPSYRTALIQAWGELRDEDRRHIDDMGDIPPRERLSKMMTSLVSPRHWTLERAVRQAFLDYGFDAEDADLRASATFAAGIGFLHLSGATPGDADTARAERFLELVLTR